MARLVRVLDRGYICRNYIGWQAGSSPTFVRSYQSSRVETPHQTLGLHERADKKEIKEAYIRLSKIYHPDKNKDPESTEEFQKIRDAYEKLMSQPEFNSTDQQWRHPDSQSPGPPRADEYSYGPGPPDDGEFRYREAFHNRRNKTRSVDDWVKNVERNARIRTKMKEQGTESQDGYRLYSEAFERDYKRYERRIVEDVDRTLDFLKVMRRRKEKTPFLFRAVSYPAWFYYLFLRYLMKLGAQTVIFVAIVLYCLEMHMADNKFDAVPEK